MTEAPPLIFEKLIAVMRTVGAVDKSGTYDDKKGTRYNFRGIDAVVNALAPAFREHGVLVMPTVLSCERETFDREMAGGRVGKQFRAVPRVQYTFYAVDGSSVSAVVEGESLDTSDKGTAKAMSVAYRVALLQSLNLPTDEPDPDTERPEVVSPPAAEPSAPAEAREKSLAAVKGLSETNQEAVKAWLKANHVPALTKVEGGPTLTQLNNLTDYIVTLTTEPFDTAPAAATPPPKPENTTIPFEPVVAKPHTTATERAQRDAVADDLKVGRQ